MFKALRNKFLAINLVSTIILMVVAFVSIYFITYKDVYKNIDFEVHRILNMNRLPFENNERVLPKNDSLDRNFPREDDLNNNIIKEPLPFFQVIVDENIEIIKVFSVFKLEELFYEGIIKEIDISNMGKGYVKYGNKKWAYIIKPEYENYKIVFLDITASHKVLLSLVYTFVFVGFVMVFIIFLVSKYYADKAIIPIKEAFEKQKQFISDASHELKTPLAIINTNVDVVLSNSNENVESQEKWLNYIKLEIERMSKLLNNLLYLAKMDNSKEDIAISKINISNIIKDTVVLMEAMIYEKKIILEQALADNLYIKGNQEMIRQIIIILLDNSIKYIGGSRKIRIGAYNKNNRIIFEIENTSEKIDEKQINRIFDRFYRIDEARSSEYGGYGLGLSIAKSIVNEHKGKIFATCEDENHFKITLEFNACQN